MSHIRTTNSAILSEADREKEISRIKRENSNILQNLSVLESELKVVVENKTQQLRHLARNYERLHELGEYTEPINHICATIAKLCNEKHLGASAQLAYAKLDPKYKQEQYAPHNNTYGQTYELPPGPNTNNTVLDTSVPEVEDNQFYGVDYHLSDIINASNGLPPGQTTFVDPTSSNIIVTDKPPEEMSRDELRKVAEALITKERKSREALLEDRRRKKEYLEECERRKVALSPEYELQLSQDHISAISPDSGPSPAWEKCLELVSAYEKLADKLHRWRPPQKIQKAMVEAFDADIEFLQPFIDEKYRKCQPAWWVVQLDNLWHGKHAAAVMNGTPISDKMRRDLTREQVGDRAPEDHARAIRFAAAIKKWKMLWVWFVEMNEKGIGVRAKELGPTLSDKAFS